jgi:hypothetical protein
MTETTRAYHRDPATGAVSEHSLPAIEVTQAVQRHPSEWSRRPDTFAPQQTPAPAAATEPGGLNPLAGVGHAFPHPMSER